MQTAFTLAITVPRYQNPEALQNAFLIAVARHDTSTSRNPLTQQNLNHLYHGGVQIMVLAIRDLPPKKPYIRNSSLSLIFNTLFAFAMESAFHSIIFPVKL